MKLLDKLNKGHTALMQSRAKFYIKYLHILGCLFIGIGLIILITESINGNIAGGLFGFIIFLIIGALSLFFYYKNKNFLIKTKAINKSQMELSKNYFKNLGNLFKK